MGEHSEHEKVFEKIPDYRSPIENIQAAMHNRSVGVAN